MALYNEILVGRYNRLVQKLFQMKGPPSMAQLAAELQPVLPIFNGVENRFLEEWTRYGLNMANTAVAGQFSTYRIGMPPGSNAIAVIESIELYTNTADAMFIIYANAAPYADLATQNFASNLYSARKSFQTPGTLLTGSAAHTSHASVVGALANPIKQVGLQANISREIVNDEDQELTLTPGETISFQNLSVNITSAVGLIWRERFLEEAERF